MSFFEKIDSFETMEQWRQDYKKRSGGFPPPAALCADMVKVMRAGKLSWKDLARLIAQTGQLPKI